MTPATPAAPSSSDPGQLIALLRQAAQLEHSLMLAYLHAAFSIKSTPQEFARLSDGSDNPRRAYQFERARTWKRSMLSVAVEEMLHLHYVQCLLRALGETPCFDLPERDESGNWIIRNWLYRPFDPKQPHGATPVVLGPLSVDAVRHFFAYESSDTFQSEIVFGNVVKDLLCRCYDFEREFHMECIAFGISDDAQRLALIQKLRPFYMPEVPPPIPVQDPKTVEPPSTLAPPLPPGKFFSIGDLYRDSIQPLYNEAFEKGWVKHSNRKLNNETLAPGGFHQRLVPIGPLQRSNRFAQFLQKTATDPLRDFKNVANVIEVIVDEGEGIRNVFPRAMKMLSEVEQAGGLRAYLLALQQMLQGGPSPAGTALGQNQLLRDSHLYQFAMIMADLEHELNVAPGFQPTRTMVSADCGAAVQRLIDELPRQFNACYLVLMAWLSRIYEIPHWKKDAARRQSIEMLASWPMMSTAIRPLLEILSFFPVSPARLFLTGPDDLPAGGVEALRLRELFQEPVRSEHKNREMDELALATLARVGRWCDALRADVENAALPSPQREMILRRLRGMNLLGEYRRQFPFRVAGGYSNTMPDAEYVAAHPGGGKYSEDPRLLQPIYSKTLLLRLRFSGWALLQLATDPDPAIDEVGCTGTSMFHPADGDRRFNQAIVWQTGDGSVILREPREQLPPIGVNCVDASLFVAAGDATAVLGPSVAPPATPPGPHPPPAPPAVAIQLQGISELATFGADQLCSGGGIKFNLLEKDGVKPFYNGMNHVIWQDGEPIDPFVLSVTASRPDAPEQPVFQREAFNEGVSFVQMEPLQRLEAAREPTGYEFNLKNLPAWAVPAGERAKLQAGTFPASYLSDRVAALTAALSQSLDAQKETDAIISFSERLALLATPLSTTTMWLNVLAYYGHTLSGETSPVCKDNPVLAALARLTNLQLTPAAAASRNDPNARWLVKYALGVMDTDALSHLVFGELYIPVEIELNGQPVRLKREWTCPGATVADLSQYACQFGSPFWAAYRVAGSTRTLDLGDGTVLTETLQPPAAPDSYSYQIAGLPGAGPSMATLAASEDGGQVRLSWEIALAGADTGGAVAALGIIGSLGDQMQTALQSRFPNS